MAQRTELVLFDFGGVVADEGFRDGLRAIAHGQGLDPEGFYRSVCDIIRESGYLTGRSSEAAFWETVRRQTGMRGDDGDAREAILQRFVLRPWMLAHVQALRTGAVRVALLSDQTDWLDELDRRHGFFHCFESVFNSYHLHQSKHDPAIFDRVTGLCGVDPAATLFVDDTPGHIERARTRGLQTIWYTGREAFERELAGHVPDGAGS
jgi:putative hydrolase of the HAD superfamily